MTDDITRDSLQIARLEERMATMDRDMQAQTVRIEAMQVQLGQVLATLSEARGGWRTLMWIGGGAASIGGVIGWAASHLQFIKG